MTTSPGATPVPGAKVPSALPVFEHRLTGYRRVWRGSLFTTFLVPILFLLGIGVSVGAYVNRGGSLGVSYLDYMAPGLLASTALQVAIGEATWPVLGGFMWVRTYHAMRASPLRPVDMVGGELAFNQLRVGLSATAFLVVMTAFGAMHSWWAVAALPVSLLLGAAVSLPVMAYAASITSDNMFAILWRFAVTPMTLFAGVFFPVSALPPLARYLAYVSPLWHGVELSRAATLGWPTAWPVLVHVAYLGLWAALGYVLARSRFERRLTD